MAVEDMDSICREGWQSRRRRETNLLPNKPPRSGVGIPGACSISTIPPLHASPGRSAELLPLVELPNRTQELLLFVELFQSSFSTAD